jgi:hypothetical protein
MNSDFHRYLLSFFCAWMVHLSRSVWSAVLQHRFRISAVQVQNIGNTFERYCRADRLGHALEQERTYEFAVKVLREVLVNDAKKLCQAITLRSGRVYVDAIPYLSFHLLTPLKPLQDQVAANPFLDILIADIGVPGFQPIHHRSNFCFTEQRLHIFRFVIWPRRAR